METQHPFTTIVATLRTTTTGFINKNGFVGFVTNIHPAGKARFTLLTVRVFAIGKIFIEVIKRFQLVTLCTSFHM